MDGLGGSQQMTVYPLSSLDPVTATSTIRSMFLKDGSAAPTVEPDVYGRQLMIRGSADQLAQIRTLLAQLGEDGSGQRSGNNTSRVRTVPLSGRDPEELLPLLQKMWGASNAAPIRVVNPQERGAAPSRTSLPRSRTQTPNALPTPGKPSAQLSPARGLRVISVAQTMPAQNDGQSSLRQDDAALAEQLNQFLGTGETAKPTAAPAAPRTVPTQPSPSAEAKAPPAEVSITVMGDELVISSSDPARLNELQELLERTMQALPPRITWTVFTLQAADATEASNMLKLLFPGSSVTASSTTSGGGFFGSLTSGASSLGNSLADMTGLGTLGASQHLRIIPDVRLNALFVAGPAAQVREVEEMLKVLDSTDLGSDSFRDKFSRLIPINHADAQEVYNVVKEVYKNYIDPPRTNDNANNPFAMLAAGGRGRSGNGQDAPPPAARLAIGVDTNASNLIVWADESLFREIESLVQSLDKAAEDARRTVKVVTLENTNSTVVQGALGSLMPRVKISTTGTRQTASSTTGATPSPTGNTSSSGQSQDQMRQFIEQRMRDRMMQGGGTGGFGGGGPGGFGGGGFGGGGPGGFGGGGFGGRGNNNNNNNGGGRGR
jgi:type II secretory pathway component GspD/PulD (secretin)